MHKISSLYQFLSREENKKRVEKVFIIFAFTAFLVHLLLIIWIRLFDFYPKLFSLINPNFLSALYTPFSIILLYEVYFMILTLPLSFTESIKRQYQVISLIVIRRVFKDIGSYESFADMTENMDTLVTTALDLGSGLAMYGLIAAFVYLTYKTQRRDVDPEVSRFIRFKEGMAIALVLFLAGLSLYSFSLWSYEVYSSAYLGAAFDLNLDNLFFVDLFGVMIFTDLLIFIASFIYSDDYAILFRNAGFVVSTVLIRISFTIHDKFGVLVAVGAVIIGLVVLKIYQIYQKLDLQYEKT